MVALAVDGINLFKIAGRSRSGWIPSFKTGTASHIQQPFCSRLEERLLLWLEYHPQVKSYARGDIGTPFATTYRLPTLKHAPFAIGYTFIETKHFLDSGTRLVEGPDCAATRSLELHKSVLRFKSHDKRKTQTPNIDRRWARGKTDWDVVGGENRQGVYAFEGGE